MYSASVCTAFTPAFLQQKLWLGKGQRSSYSSGHLQTLPNRRNFVRGIRFHPSIGGLQRQAPLRAFEGLAASTSLIESTKEIALSSGVDATWLEGILQELATEQQTSFGMVTGVPLGDLVVFLLGVAYLTSTPSVLLGAIDNYIMQPLDLILQKKIDESQLVLSKQVGTGSFGTVYLADLGGREVIVKKVKSVPEARNLAEVEEYMNRRLRRSLALSFVRPPYIGSFYESNGSPVLVWGSKGLLTLETLMSQRSFPLNCEEYLFGREQKGPVEKRERKVVATITKQILTALDALHKSGIVHRDVKPSNLVLMDGRFTLVDFGAATDLRTGKNYIPEQALLDPGYSPPEQYVLPEDTPEPPPAPVSAALAPFLWKLNQPDLFDTYSAGLVLLQLACPSLRGANALKPTGVFQRNLKECDYDLRDWRSNYSGNADLSLLDDGAGWSLCCKLVCDRKQGRLSASQALLHPFVLLA